MDAVTTDPLLPGRILPADYLGQPAWRRRVQVLRDAGRQLRTFNGAWLNCQECNSRDLHTVQNATTDSPMKPVQIPPDGGKQVNILGIPMAIRIHGRDTGGLVSVVESHDVPGGGPPQHIHHREDETFQILEGEYEFLVGGKTILAKPGTTLFAPRGSPHTYRYLGQTPGRLMCVITPSGFEGFFEEIGALSPQQQQDIPRVIEIAKNYGFEILPPPGA